MRGSRAVMKMGNIFADIPARLPKESFDSIVRRPGIQIERIVSKGQKSKLGFWYRQRRNEWVIVLKGRAKLRFEGEPELVVLKAGDYVLIPAGARHRVEWTLPKRETVWLTVWYSS